MKNLKNLKQPYSRKPNYSRPPLKTTKAVWCYHRDSKVLKDMIKDVSEICPKLKCTGEAIGNILIITENLEYFYYLGDPIDLDFGLFPNFEFQFTKDFQELISLVKSWK